MAEMMMIELMIEMVPTYNITLTVVFLFSCLYQPTEWYPHVL